MIRTFDARLVNKWVERDGGEGDFTELLDNKLNVCLTEGEGGALFAWRRPGIYEVHVFFKQRGRDVLAVSRSMLNIMRDAWGAKLFWAAVPIRSRRVVIFTRLMGWKSHGIEEFPHGPCEVFSGE